MTSTKCPNCNLVNFATAENCQRCNTDLTLAQNIEPNLIQPTNLLPLQGHHSGFHCPFCQSDKGYYVTFKTSGAGCAVSIILLIIFFPLCWIGLLMKSEERFCGNCNMKLG